MKLFAAGGTSVVALLSINLDAKPAPLPARSFYARTWGGNEGVLEQLVEQGDADYCLSISVIQQAVFAWNASLFFHSVLLHPQGQ